MDVTKLRRDQLTELKCNYYCHELHPDEGVSYGDLAEIDCLVSDDTIFEEYAGVDFSMDDFFGSAGEEEPDDRELLEYIIEVPVYLRVTAYDEDGALDQTRNIIAGGNWTFNDPEIIEIYPANL